mmetsp:Transcript_20358/g.49200  ORF Transcript_20358/g.49200 Transcript_20358/m.49200 type:complete len:394 (-) Transcript_20358:7072-8253(-)
MVISVSLATTTFSLMSMEVRFASSSDSISSTSSVMSPWASASLRRRSSSSCFSLTVNSFCCLMSTVFSSSRSGRSFVTTLARSWSSRPSSVTMKLMSVHSACTSGGKCGFASLVWRMSLKLLWYSTSLSPTLTKKLRPFLIFCRPTIGPITASSDCCRFSIITDHPFSRAFSITLIIPLVVRRVIWRLLRLSFSLTHTIPCSCGSIISGHRSAKVVIAPFSTETRSEGSPSEFHCAICAESVRIARGSAFSDMGMLLVLRNERKHSFTSCVRKCLLKHPTYETKAAASSTSPGRSAESASMVLTLTAQRSCSEPSAAIKRCASPSLFWRRSPSATTAFFSATTLSYSAMRTESLASRSATCAWTSLSFAVASARSSWACLSMARLGSTVTTMS